MISVVIPSLGLRPFYLERAFNSVHNAFKGKVDYEIVAMIGEKLPYEHRNNGVQHAKGDYILFLDDDDCITEDFVCEDLLDCIKHKADFIMYDAEHIAAEDYSQFKTAPTGCPGWPCKRWDTALQLKAALDKGSNMYTVGSYLIGKALFHIKWPDTEFEDYDYNKAIVDEIVRQGLCMCTVPDSVKYLYTLHPAGSRNQPR